MPSRPGPTEDQILSVLEVRRQRSRVFGEKIFLDPAWDILLELYAAKLGDRRVTLSDLSPVAPRSTLARWVDALVERNLVVCDVDPFAADEFWIALSDDCAARMCEFLSTARHLVGESRPMGQ